MEHHGTTPASANDSWSAYTHLEGQHAWEIRHPKAPFSQGYSVMRWSKVGHTFQGHTETLAEAHAYVAAQEGVQYALYVGTRGDSEQNADDRELVSVHPTLEAAEQERREAERCGERWELWTVAEYE